MHKLELGELIQYAVATWPHSPFPEETMAVWKTELADLSYDEAAAAVTALARAGQVHAPAAGLVRREVIKLRLDPPPWGDVLRALNRLNHTGVYSSVYGGEEDRITRARQIMDRWPDVVRTFIERVGFRQIAENLAQGGNGEARLRTKWEEFVRDSVDTGALAGLPAPEGMHRLERANRTGPSLIGGAVRAALEPGKP